MEAKRAVGRIVDNPAMKSRQWDIFCKVIDNFGDIGICWRLSADLASRGEKVRLWVDDASALAWMAPQGHGNVRVLEWASRLHEKDLASAAAEPCDVLIEAFGCNPPPEFLQVCANAVHAGSQKPVWLNLEYLSAEPYAARNHAMPSPVVDGPAAGWNKWFFYPGFTEATGGLLREAGLAARQDRFDATHWLDTLQIRRDGKTLISLFCYEPPALKALLSAWTTQGLHGNHVHLLVAAGRAAQAVQKIIRELPFATAKSAQNQNKNRLQPNIHESELLSISYIPLISQTSFDELLWACDLNFVRGEDSIVRAIWAGKPFVWQIYPQDDGAHHPKLDALLDTLDAPTSCRVFHHTWNAGIAEPERYGGLCGLMDLPRWAEAATTAKARLVAQSSLTDRLLGFVEKSR
jgi:uncharacterized repeat protein (TIGR03837 family)